jgi:hypothetical protein
MVDILLAIGNKITLKLNGIHVGVGKIVSGSTIHVLACHGQVFVRALRVDYSHNQLVINHQCIGDYWR